MKIGLTLPQGCDREYLGMEAREAWESTVAVAQWAEAQGFESLWLYDHFQVDPPLIEAPIFEPFVEIAALATVTSRARLGHLVLAAAYRNAALTAKMISTVDVISNGRTELGIGAGWKQDEWLAYGYGFPDAPERLAILADHLEIITRMLAPGRATYEGVHAHVRDAIHEPKGLQQPRLPIVVGGNGPKVTWRLAARFADELNLDGIAVGLPVNVDQQRWLSVRRNHRVDGLHAGRHRGNVSNTDRNSRLCRFDHNVGNLLRSTHLSADQSENELVIFFQQARRIYQVCAPY